MTSNVRLGWKRFIKRTLVLTDYFTAVQSYIAKALGVNVTDERENKLEGLSPKNCRFNPPPRARDGWLWAPRH